MIIPVKSLPVSQDSAEIGGLVDMLQSVLSRLDVLGVMNGAAELDHAIHKLRQSLPPNALASMPLPPLRTRH